MRWPLKNQILVRMLLLLVVVTAAITLANIRSIIATNRAEEIGRLVELKTLLANSNFPLTPAVLDILKTLSGAEFALTADSGRIITSTIQSAGHIDFTDIQMDAKEIRTFSLDNKPYYHASLLTKPAREGERAIHVFIPRQTDRSVWWQASRGPLVIALLVLPIALLLSYALAGQVTRPLNKLQTQVQRIAQGNHEPVNEVWHNDEIRDLNDSINEMALKLQSHDDQLRRNERLRTMVQFSNSIAHHLRNSATGCKMAVELLASEHDQVPESETYQVVVRQLDLINAYIKKFLVHSKATGQGDVVHQWVNLQQVLEQVTFLLMPTAKHLNVQLTTQFSGGDDGEIGIKMATEDAEQLMMNLISNAITAASELAVSTNEQTGSVQAALTADENRIEFIVTDNGSGPPSEIADNLFQPFVTGRREGTGLGLSLVREITERYGGSVDWSRTAQRTNFIVELPSGTVSRKISADQNIES